MNADHGIKARVVVVRGGTPVERAHRAAWRGDGAGLDRAAEELRLPVKEEWRQALAVAALDAEAWADAPDPAVAVRRRVRRDLLTPWAHRPGGEHVASLEEVGEEMARGEVPGPEGVAVVRDALREGLEALERAGANPEDLQAVVFRAAGFTWEETARRLGRPGQGEVLRVRLLRLRRRAGL